MSLITLVVLIILVGVGLYVVNTMIPMDQKIKTILNIVVVVALILWLLEAFGIFHGPVFGPRVR